MLNLVDIEQMPDERALIIRVAGIEDRDLVASIAAVAAPTCTTWCRTDVIRQNKHIFNVRVHENCPAAWLKNRKSSEDLLGPILKSHVDITELKLEKPPKKLVSGKSIITISTNETEIKKVKEIIDQRRPLTSFTTKITLMIPPYPSDHEELCSKLKDSTVIH